MGKISESIFSAEGFLIPMADVQHVENLDKPTIRIITKHTKWNNNSGKWENPIYLPRKLKDRFIQAYTYYRYELEKEFLIDPMGDEKNENKN